MTPIQIEAAQKEGFEIRSQVGTDIIMVCDAKDSVYYGQGIRQEDDIITQYPWEDSPLYNIEIVPCNTVDVEDTLNTVQTLKKRIQKLAKKSVGDTRTFWGEFLKDIYTWIRKEKKRLAAKWENLRWAAKCAESAEEMIGTNFAEVGEQQIWNNWEAYLLYVEKANRDKDYSNRAYMAGRCTTGDLREAKVFDTVKNIAKLCRLYIKKSFKGLGLSVKISGGNCIRITHLNNLVSELAADVIYTFAERFNYDYSNSMVDYFNTRFYISSSVQG